MKRRLCVLLSVLVLVALMLTGCGIITEKNWQEQYDLGLRYMDDGAYTEAVIAFTAAISIDAKREEAYLGRAYAHICLGDYSAAWADCQKADELEPNKPTVQEVIQNYREYMKAMSLS